MPFALLIRRIICDDVYSIPTICFLTAFIGSSNIASTVSFHSAADRLKLAPGNHEGRYCTGVEKIEILPEASSRRYSRIGNTSTVGALSTSDLIVRDRRTQKGPWSSDGVDALYRILRGGQPRVVLTSHVKTVSDIYNHRPRHPVPASQINCDGFELRTYRRKCRRKSCGCSRIHRRSLRGY